MDEFAEFRRETLQALRQPLEDGIIRIVRARWAVTYPARFQLIAAANPCPCGFEGDEVKGCSCLPGPKDSYRSRLRGPVIDRIDLQCTVARIKREELFEQPPGDASAIVAEEVAAARERQRDRYGQNGPRSNADVEPRDIDMVCRLQRRARRRLEQAIERQSLTARGAHRVIRVARTVADLACEEEVAEEHVAEALRYRVFDTVT